MTYSKRFSSKFFARLLKPEGQNPIRDRATSFEIIFNLLDEKKDKSNYLIAVSYTHLTLPTNREV